MKKLIHASCFAVLLLLAPLSNFGKAFAPGSELSVYPNPSSDIVTVTGGSSGENLVVTNLLGIEVLSVPWKEGLKIDVSTYTPGIYFVTVGERIKRVIVSR